MTQSREEIVPHFSFPDGAPFALAYEGCTGDFSLLSPSPFPLPSREGDSKSLSPRGRWWGEGESAVRKYGGKLAHMRRSTGTRKCDEAISGLARYL